MPFQYSGSRLPLVDLRHAFSTIESFYQYPYYQTGLLEHWIEGDLSGRINPYRLGNALLLA